MCSSNCNGLDLLAGIHPLTATHRFHRAGPWDFLRPKLQVLAQASLLVNKNGKTEQLEDCPLNQGPHIMAALGMHQNYHLKGG